MLDYISFEIQVEIIKRLPVKSLLRFRSVSKSWKSLINSSEFIASYNIRQTQPHLFIWRTNGNISIMHEDTFAQQDFAPTIPELLLQRARVVGSSHGLFCLYDSKSGTSLYNCAMEIAALWNPSIRKLVAIAVSSCDESQSEIILGFGVSPVTIDPTIVKITQFNKEWDWDIQSWVHNPWVVEVFTLSSGKWKTIPSTKLALKNSIRVTWSQIVIDRFIYWFGYCITLCHDLIISFDMTTEEFRTISLPNSSEHEDHSEFFISKVSESLGVVEHIPNFVQDTCVVWRMDNDDGVSSSFTKLFTIDMPFGYMKTLGFTMSGSKPLIIVPHSCGNQRALAVYDPFSPHINKIRIIGKYRALLFVGSYVETLLLIDQLDNSIYVEAGVSVFSDDRPLREQPTNCPLRTIGFHGFFKFSLLKNLCNSR